MLKLKKSVSLERECSQCLAPPPRAKYCPRCGRPITGIQEEVIESAELFFECDNDPEGYRMHPEREGDFREFDPQTAFNEEVNIKICEESEGRIRGTWRIKNKVGRKYNLEMGEASEWEVRDNTQSQGGEASKHQEPRSIFYRLRLLNIDEDDSDVTFLLEKVRRCKRKS